MSPEMFQCYILRPGNLMVVRLKVNFSGTDPVPFACIEHNPSQWDDEVLGLGTISISDLCLSGSGGQSSRPSPGLSWVSYYSGAWHVWRQSLSHSPYLP